MDNPIQIAKIADLILKGSIIDISKIVAYHSDGSIFDEPYQIIELADQILSGGINSEHITFNRKYDNWKTNMELQDKIISYHNLNPTSKKTPLEFLTVL